MEPVQSSPPKRRLRLPQFTQRISWRDLLAVWIPVALLIVAAFAIALHFVQPAPSKHLVIAVGTEDGAYYAAARRYTEALKQEGITLEVRRTPGSIENLQGLSDRNSGIDIGFVQGGIGDAAANPDLISLGSLFYEPVWIFYRGENTLDRLTQLRGLRIAIGPDGSGTRKLAFALFEANGLTAKDLRLSELSGGKAADALTQGKLDAALFVASPDARAVARLLRDDKVRLMSLSQVQAYARRFPYLSAVTLPQGGIDLARDIPAQDVRLLATTATLIAHDDLHPALAGLLAGVLGRAHGGSGLFNAAGEFPSTKNQDFPVSEEAEHYYKSGPPFLQRFLPFWAAILADRLFILLIPLIAVAFPLMRILPPLYNWRISSRIYRHYGELRELEETIAADPTPTRKPEYLAALKNIEEHMNGVPVPLAFNQQLYTFREHIHIVRRRILALGQPEHA